MVADRYRLRYKLTPQDYQDYSKLAANRSRGSRSWLTILAAVLVGILSAGLLIFLQKTGILTHETARIAIAGAAFGAFLIIVLYALLYMKILRGMVGDHDTMVGKFSLTAYDGGGLQITGSHMQSSFDWTAFIDLTPAARIIVIWVDTGIGVILPNSAFSGEQEKQQFVDYLKERIESHRQAG